jgi:hypothetical protein
MRFKADVGSTKVVVRQALGGGEMRRKALP